MTYERQALVIKVDTGQQLVPQGWRGVWMAVKTACRKKYRTEVHFSCYVAGDGGRLATPQIEIRRTQDKKR